MDFENSTFRFLWSGIYSKLTTFFKRNEKNQKNLGFNHQENQDLRKKNMLENPYLIKVNNYLNKTKI